MLHLNTTEEVIRNYENTCQSIKLTVSVYKDPITTKTYLVREEFDDAEPTFEITNPDWPNNTALASKELTFSIPSNKQTTTYPTANRVPNTEYDGLIREWRTLYESNSDYIQIQKDLLTENREHDGHYES